MKLKEQAEELQKKLKSFGVKEWGVILLTGICCMILVLPAGEKEQEAEHALQTVHQETIDTNTSEDYVKELENRLTELLACVENVGEVKVMITVQSTTEKKVLQDGVTQEERTTEQDSAGGSRSAESIRTEGSTVFAGEGDCETPYVLSENYPEITGVVVIAKGSGKGTVDYDILNAVQVLFDVPAHKIKIMKMK